MSCAGQTLGLIRFGGQVRYATNRTVDAFRQVSTKPDQAQSAMDHRKSAISSNEPKVRPLPEPAA
jgi:hypothetical protein